MGCHYDIIIFVITVTGVEEDSIEDDEVWIIQQFDKLIQTNNTKI